MIKPAAKPKTLTSSVFGSFSGPLAMALAASLSSALLSGCASDARTKLPAVAPAETAFRHAPDPIRAPVAADGAWWAAFKDDTLARLVERAAASNHDVLIAVERVRQARAGETASASRLWPSVDLTASASDSRSGLPEAVKQRLPDTRAARAGLNVGWELDVFGGARAAADAAGREAQAASFGVAGAQLLAASEVARQYFIWQGARERLRIVEALAQTQRDTERLTRSREGAGLASRFDVARASAEATNLESQLPPLRSLTAVTEARIAVLLGASPSAPLPELSQASAPSLPDVPEVAAGQAPELLQRRPDLLAAERRLAAASARLVEARAEQWPKILLGALFGRQDLTLNGLDLAPVRFSNFALAFTLPLFNAGRIRAGIDLQSSREREAWLDYERALLGAVEDVENSLVALRQERERLVALQATVEARRTALAHAQSLHREGQIDLLQLLDAQRGALAAELALADSGTQRALDAVQLYKALGGGWQQLPPPRALASASAQSDPKR